MGRSVLWIAALVLVASCGGSDSSHVLTGQLPVDTSVVDRSVDWDGEPTTIVDDAHELELPPSFEVETAFDDLITRRIECGRRPWSCDPAELTVDGSPTRQRFDELFATRRSAGIVASDDGEFRYRIDDVRTRSDSEVQVTTCITDDTVLVDANGWVFDDGLFSGTVQFDMTNTAEGWRWSDDRVLSYTYGEDLCGLLD